MSKTAQHVIAMETDAYLCGHPEWHEIVKDAHSELETTFPNGNSAQFPNGFESWQETHFEIVSAITDARNLPDDQMPLFIQHINNTQGTGGFYELAKELTDKFETNCPADLFNDMDYFETIESFIETEIYNASCE